MLLLLLGLTATAQAQSGPYGNEWINPAQTYYKVKVLRDGLYRLDYNYLNRAGITGVSPQRIQVWRRGREVARYIGGNRTQLDASTYIEFYGQRNDGLLDREMYKAAAHQPNKLYSLFTDTAAYFLTWSATTNGRDMAEPATSAATAHANWQGQQLDIFKASYMYGQIDGHTAYVPWADEAEGFMTTMRGRVDPNIPDPNEILTLSLDSLALVASSGASPQLEVVLVGSSPVTHNTTISVGPTTTALRSLGTVTYNRYEVKRVVFPIQRSDIGSNGVVYVRWAVTNAAATPTDRFRTPHVRITFPQQPNWTAGQRQLAFRSDSTLAGPAYYQLSNVPATVRGFDVTDPNNVQRVTGIALAGTQRGYLFPAANGRTRHLLLFDEAQSLVPLPAQRVRFRAINPASHNFLIVSHALLMRPVNGVNPVREYAKYRATAGPNHLAYDTLVVTSDQLYDQFHYGERSPLAVRHFAKFMLTAPRTDRYLLLLGKGVLITEDLGTRDTDPVWPLTLPYRRETAARRAVIPDLVPTSTRGGSDIFFTADWETGSYIPRIPVGRVAAIRAEQVLNYLNKLKEHEALGPEPWRKNILHMAGGQTLIEHATFQAFLRDYQRKAEAPFFGGRVQNLYNTTTGGSPVVVDITPQVNAGLSLITYFGHGSTRYLNLMPTEILDPTSTYNNRGKYPVFFAFGCAVGSSYTIGGYSTINTPNPIGGSIGEDWVLAANKGAVGFLAETDFGIDGELHQYAQELYKLLFNEANWYGKPITVLQAEVNRRLLATGLATTSPYYGVTMLMNTAWQGDPALVMFAPEAPDYQFAQNAATVEASGSGPVLATSPRFNVRLRLSNPGKIERVPLRITVARTVNSNPPVTLPVTVDTIPYFRRDTTVVIQLTNPANVSVLGRNTFTVKLDDPNVIDELNENNNSTTFDFNFLNGGVTALNPPEFAIVNRTNVRLVGQSNLAQTQPLSYEFQLDTIPTFAAPLRSGTVQGLDVASWTPNLPAPTAGRDSVVYYWRFRFSPVGAPAGLDVSWATSSFRLINNSPEGWSQSHYGQMASTEKRGISQAAPSGRWEFAERTVPVQLLTAGGGATGTPATFQLTYGIQPNGNSVRVDNCGVWRGLNVIEQANIMVAVFEGRNLRQLNSLPGGPYQTCGQVGSTTYFHFASADFRDLADDVNTPARQQQLLRLLQNVPDGAYVALVSVNRVNFSSMNPAVKAALAAMGSQLINTAQDGDPLVMMLHKGFPNDRQEATFAASSSTPRYDQAISLNTTLRTRVGSGTVVSTRVGPAQQWQTLYHTIKKPEAADSYTLRLIGYDRNNTRTVLQQNVTSSSFSLAGVSATQYPYLQLEADLRDTTNLTPPQLKQWLVTYRGVPEGVVRRDHPRIPANAYSPATLSAAAANSGVLSIPVYFENVSSVDFPALTRAQAVITETRAGGRVDTVSIRASRVAGFSRLPRADSTAVYNFSLNVAALRGDATIRIIANSQNLPELVTYNNELNLSFTAPTITVAPVLDVAFDGAHILNGDIVSASPEILVDVKYEDGRRPLTDPNKVQVFLTRPGSQVAEQVSMTNTAQIRFVNDAAAQRSRVYYTPGTLDDGVYKLEVQARDMNDNQVSAQRYAVTFEVVNKTSISNIFPYPNPITNRARFVFTLTGTTPPRNMKIQILTLSGKVVREIMQAELGNLRIGNNITEYAWDGTDEYGDRLANGTYLYRVVMDDADKPYEHRATAADKAFKKGWGKLVLLR
ncbi:hypothetical protein GCM10027048_04650 [Hymenobacter coalescens]